MKKYKIIIALFTGLYLVLAVILSITMNHFADKQNNEYRVEISRLSREIMNSEVLNDGKDNDIMVIDANRYLVVNDIFNIFRVTYLSVGTDHSNVISEFYSSRNKYQMEIVPVIKEEQVIGYLRFDYKKDIDVSSFCRLSQGFLLLIYLLTVSILIYTDQKIIKPFHQLSNMPYELSKGNLHDEIKESKNRYFGRFIWGIGMLRDALESHKNKELKLARDKKMILLSISHDIKTPLNAINLYAKALEQGLYDTEEEKAEAVIKIQEKTTEINEFVKDIMKSTTEDVISIEVNNSEYYLTELINKIAAGYSERCRLSQMEFVIGSYDNPLLKGDIERMYEAAGNLIENAFKYGDGKRISITFTEEDYCVLIHIFNSGIPVSDSELPHLFDSFYRGSNTEGKAGNGLGLYICSEIMKKMNGDIFARKGEDGMEFILVCPMS